MAAAVGRPLTSALRRQERSAVLALAALTLCAANLLPLLVLVGEAVVSWKEAIAVLATPRVWALLARSLTLSSVVTVLALLAGVPMGVVLGRTDILGRRAAAVLQAVPVFLPPFLLALGWFHLFGARGQLGSERSSNFLFSEGGVAGVLALAFVPVVTSLVGVALQGIDPSFEEAARIVAQPARVVVGILLPAASPALVLAAIVVFTLAFSELGVPMFLRVDEG